MNGIRLRTRQGRVSSMSKVVGVLSVGLCLLLLLSALVVAEEPGGRGGPFVMFDYLDLDPINNYLRGLNLSPFDDGPITLYGCEGMVNRDGITFGGLYAHGTLAKQVGSQRQELSISFYGPIAEYRILKKESFDLAIVGGLGIASAGFTLIGPKSSRFSLNSFLIHGGLKLAYNISKSISLKASLAYSSLTEKDWTRVAGELPSPDNFDLSSLHFRFGVRIGGKD